MTPVVSLAGVQLRRGGRSVLRGVHLTAQAGEVVALMGLSGSGKTTLLRLLARLETPDAGEIVAPPAGLVFQFHFLFEHLSALDNVCLALVHVQRLPRADAEARARRLLEELGVGHRADALPRHLSGGEAQRVAIARALAVDPPVLLLDEPTASLDPARRADLAGALRRLAQAGRTLILTSHDDDFVRAAATRVLVLAEGVVVESGDPTTVLSAPVHEATRQLLRQERLE
jgi:ABC-type polar amino acid transport system ATPase subunit